MAWWDWDEWQRMIDWMALKGINTPLAVTGQEAVWRLVLRDLGFSEAQIAEFLVGPAYLPWGWMGNIDGLGGPLPDSWIDSHITLERQILARERALGMTPVLQGFTGHVPESITQVFPAAKIHQTGDWSAGFSGTWFLDPLDPLFQRIGRRFIERQTELFGTDHLYAADPLQRDRPAVERSRPSSRGWGAPSTQSMQAADADATWVLQGWFLYYQAKFWQEPQARALLGAVPDDRMMVLDLWGDRHPVWQARRGVLRQAVDLERALQLRRQGEPERRPAEDRRQSRQRRSQSPDRGRLTGLGMMMEGLGTNPIVPDFVMDQTWRDERAAARGVDAGLRRAALWRAPTSHAWHAWQLLLATAYRSGAQTGNFLAERPQFYVKGTRVPDRSRSRRTTCGRWPRRSTRCSRRRRALGGNDAYRYDVVNLTRQVLGQLGLPLVNRVQDGLHAKGPSGAPRGRGARPRAARATSTRWSARARNSCSAAGSPTPGAGARPTPSGDCTSGTRATSSRCGAPSAPRGRTTT